MSFPWEKEEQGEPVQVPWQKITGDNSPVQLTRKERRELAERKASQKKPSRRKRVRAATHASPRKQGSRFPKKVSVTPLSEVAAVSGSEAAPEQKPQEEVQKTASSSTPSNEAGHKSKNQKFSFSKRDAATAALLTGTLGLGMVFALADFTRSSTVYAEMEEVIKGTQGEIVAKEYDESQCPSDLYVVPVTESERSRSMVWGETTEDGQGLVCLDSPYFFTVDDKGEEVLVPVELNVYEAYEVGEEYSFDQELYDQRETSARSILPDEENTLLKYGTLGASVLMGVGAVGINITPSASSSAKREEGQEEEED